MIFDNSIKNLVTAAFESEKDVFLRMAFPDIAMLSDEQIPSVCFLQSVFCANDIFEEISNLSGVFRYKRSSFLLADVRLLREASFRNLLRKERIRRIIIPFGECALSGEYVYRESMSLIGEFREETPYFCQVAAFLPPCPFSSEELLIAFGCDDAVSVGENEDIPFVPFRTGSVSAKFYYTASEAEKYAYKKVCVFFNSRGEAREFAAFLNKRGTPFCYIDGECDTFSRRQILDSFFSSDVNIILATRSILPDMLFYHTDISIFCGVPFSVSHIFRCAAASREKKLLIIYCENDFERNDRISHSLSVITDNEEIYEKRQQSLSYIRELIKDE